MAINAYKEHVCFIMLIWSMINCGFVCAFSVLDCQFLEEGTMFIFVYLEVSSMMHLSSVLVIFS